MQAPQHLSELRLVQLSDLTKREVVIGRLPLLVRTSVEEEWQSLFEAASNPTLWYRQPLVTVVIVRLPHSSAVALPCIELERVSTAEPLFTTQDR